MNDPTALRGYALQIAPELPTDRGEALRVLELLRDLIEWRYTPATPSPGRVVRLVDLGDAS